MGIPALLVLLVWGLTKLLFDGSWSFWRHWLVLMGFTGVLRIERLSSLTGCLGVARWLVLVWSTPAVLGIERLSALIDLSWCDPLRLSYVLKGGFPALIGIPILLRRSEDDQVTLRR